MNQFDLVDLVFIGLLDYAKVYCIFYYFVYGAVFSKFMQSK